jgi:hypothetical protein
MLPTLFLVSFGALVGWVTAIVRGPNDEDDRGLAYRNCVLAGAIGGGASGVLYLTLTQASVNDYNAQVNALLFAILGGIAFAAVTLRYHKHWH